MTFKKVCLHFYDILIIKVLNLVYGEEKAQSGSFTDPLQQ